LTPLSKTAKIEEEIRFRRLSVRYKYLDEWFYAKPIGNYELYKKFANRCQESTEVLKMLIGEYNVSIRRHPIIESCYQANNAQKMWEV